MVHMLNTTNRNYGCKCKYLQYINSLDNAEKNFFLIGGVKLSLRSQIETEEMKSYNSMIAP